MSGARRAGASLLELVLAFVVLAVAVVPVLSMVFGTNRMQHKVTGVFREAVAGQLLWESLKGLVTLDPYYLRDLDQILPQANGVHTGAFVEKDGPLDEQGQPIPLSPLASHLFNRSGSQLYEEANRASLATDGPTGPLVATEVASLAHNFKDLAFRLRVQMGSFSLWSTDASVDVKEVAPHEVLRDVRIDVYRIGPDRRIPAEPAFTLSSTLQTPIPSLTTPALQDYQASRDGYRYENELQAAYSSVYDELNAQRLTEDLMLGMANLVLISVESAGEAILSEGTSLGFGIPGGDTGRGTDALIAELVPRTTVAARWLEAELHTERTRGIFLAMRRSQRPIEELAAHVARVDQGLKRIIDRMKDTLGSDPLQSEDWPAVAPAVFWQRVMAQQPRWLKALERPFGYAARFETSLARAQTLFGQIEGHADATPLDRVEALNAFVLSGKSRKLFLAQAPLPEDGLVTQRGLEYQGTMRPFARSLTLDAGEQLAVLTARNLQFRAVSVAMRDLQDPEHVHRKAFEFLKPGGKLDSRIQSLIGETSTSLDSFVSTVNRALGELVSARGAGRLRPLPSVTPRTAP